MTMRRLMMLTICIMGILLVSGCAQESVADIQKEKPVKVMTVAQSEEPVVLTYYGTIAPSEIKNFTFTMGGVLSAINVKQGQVVGVGDVLASLSKDKLNIAVNTAAQQLKSAQLQFEKASESHAYFQKTYDDLVLLLANGSATQKQVDDVKLQLTISAKDMDLAASQLVQAKLQGQYQRENRDDAVLVSDMDGVVASVLYKEGELVAPGYPVVVMKSKSHVVKVGFSSTDIRKINPSTTATVTINGKPSEATVKSIAVLPDISSQTYTVEFIIADAGESLVGELVALEISSGMVAGIWLPITAIMNDGQDYVYIVKDGRAIRVNITLEERVGDQVSVKGLEIGQQLIISGTMAISHDYPVKAVEGGGQ